MSPVALFCFPFLLLFLSLFQTLLIHCVPLVSPPPCHLFSFVVSLPYSLSLLSIPLSLPPLSTSFSHPRIPLPFPPLLSSPPSLPHSSSPFCPTSPFPSSPLPTSPPPFSSDHCRSGGDVKEGERARGGPEEAGSNQTAAVQVPAHRTQGGRELIV